MVRDPDETPTASPLQDAADQRALRKALRALDRGDAESTLELLERASDPGPAARALDLVARGILAERRGDLQIAAESFDAAYRLGVPLPVLLRECGRHFASRGAYERAYSCLSLLAPVSAKPLTAFLRELPREELVRYAALSVTSALTAGRPKFYAMVDTKAALVDELGEADTALVLGSLMKQKRPWHVRRLALEGLRDFALREALEFEEISAPTDVVMSPPGFIGGGGPASIAGQTRSHFRCVLPEVTVSSKSGVMVSGDRALFDFQDDELVLTPIDFTVDPVVLACHGNELSVMVHEEGARLPALDEALALVGVHTSNFGRWVFEHLVKVFACLGAEGFAGVPIVIDAQMPPQLREALVLFAGSERDIVELPPGASIRIDRLWTCSTPAYWPAGDMSSDPTPHAELSDVRTLAPLIERVEEPLRAFDDGGHRRVYITRDGTRLANSGEVEGWFTANGFEVLDFVGLSFADQLRITRNAELIVAEGGSALYGLLFARPGVRVGVVTVAPGQEYEWFNEMFQTLGHRLLLVTGNATDPHPQYPMGSEFEVGAESLSRLVSALEALP